jgi:hypothetical protein
MMTNNTLNTRIQQIIDYITSVDDYYRGILDYANAANHRSANPAEKKLKGPLEWTTAGRVIGVR